MKIIFLGHTLFNASPSVRLHKALKEQGISSDLIAKESNVDNVKIFRPGFFYQTVTKRIRVYILNLLVWKIYKNRKNLPWTISILSPNPVSKRTTRNYDLVHLHWIANSFLNLNKLSKVNKPIVWTLHDTWSISGGCHCNLGCEKWLSACGECPQLGSKRKNDLSRILWQQKKRALNKIPSLHVVAPSMWIAEKVKKSAFYKNASVHNIPNAINTDIFKPRNKKEVRKTLGIPQDRKVIIFGAANFNKVSYKGFDLLTETLGLLGQRQQQDYFIILFGSADQISYTFPFDYKSLGTIREEEHLALAYCAADVFVGPSRQDNFPGTFVEATSCGIPSAGFDIGGIPEIVEHKKNGYIAKAFDTADLAHGIEWLTEDEERYQVLSDYARQKALDRYSYDVIAKKHIHLYEQVLNT